MVMPGSCTHCETFMRTSLVLFLWMLPTLAFAQTDVKVTAATRLDWEFASRGFPAKDTKLPATYDSTKQKYQLLVPRSFKKDQPAGLVLFISAGEPTGLSNWRKFCEAEGVLFACPYGAGNATPAGQRVRIILDVLDDVRRNFKIDPDQTVITGFSGGGRMACAIGFALPEYFGAVVPQCGTNPLPGPAWQRHRIEDRLSVAFVTGEKDMNRKENEAYMHPWFQELGIRSKLWVMPKLGHVIPPAPIVEEIHAWIAEDLKRRRDDRKARPRLAVSADDAPTGAEQAKRHVQAALEDLQTPPRTWRGVSLLQGVNLRWPKLDAGAEARAALNKLGGDDKILDRVELQGSADEIKSLSAQAKALERFGDVARAIDAWEVLAKNYQGTPAGDSASANVKRLRKK